jgi:hypothetical protein
MAVSVKRSTRAAFIVVALCTAAPASAQVAGPQSIPATRSGPYIAYGPVCDRAALRECDAEARFKMSMCDPFSGRFVCADRILAERGVCLAATGCD